VRITRLRDLDGNLHVVQNGSVTTATNLSLGFANVNIDIGVSYDTDIDKLEKIINKLGEQLAQDENHKDNILEPIAFLRLDSFGDSSVNVKALGKVKPGTQWEIAGEFRRRLKKEFDKNGIEIPFPQRVIHHIQEESKTNSKHKK
jgi:small conductance mechanosensitive channel